MLWCIGSSVPVSALLPGLLACTGSIEPRYRKLASIEATSSSVCCVKRATWVTKRLPSNSL